MEFEWDDDKAASNYKKHGVRFSEAVTIWLDESALEIPDPNENHAEERWLRLGFSRDARILVVVYVERVEGARMRIISARTATRREQDQYNSR